MIKSSMRRAAAALSAMALAAAGAIVVTQQTANAAESTIISTADTTWRYLDDGSNPAQGNTPDVWAAPSFDDSDWKSAKGSFGAKRGVIGDVDGYLPATLLNQYAEGTTNNPAFFFRTAVTLTGQQVEDTASAVATILYDDAASLFVNGTYVGGGHDADLQASADRNTSYGGSNDAAPNTTAVTIPVELLVEGENTFAVRLHNGRADSSDVYLDVASVVLSSTEIVNPVWSYHDLDADPTAGLDDPHAWAAPDFDDSSWPSAEGSFGALRGQLASVSGFMPDNLLTQYKEGTTTNIGAFFFRTTLDVTADELDDAWSLDVSIRYDDAVALFVNGVYAGGLDDSSFLTMDNPNRAYGGSNSGTPKLGTIRARATLFNEGTNTIGVRLHNGRETSSDLYFEWLGHEKNTEVPPPPPAVTNLVLGVGNDETERTLVWYASETEGQQAVIQRSDELADGEFTDAATVIAPKASGASLAAGLHWHHADIVGLEEGTSYSYRVGSEANGWSDTKVFSTESSSEFEYIAIGDAQIGSSGNPQNDSDGWANTLEVAHEMFPGANLLVSAGDQVESAGNETEYAGLTAPARLGGFAFSPTIGNHDVGNRTTYEQHFNIVNQDSSTRDNWFVYNDVLFMVVDTNLRNTAAHRAFMEDAIEAAGDVSHKVVVMHHSIYSTANHSLSSDIVERRQQFPPVFSELGVDYVIAGHDHVYARTHLMKGTSPVTSGTPAEHTPKAGEFLGLTLNSSSGSKYYNIRDNFFDYVSVTKQDRVPSFTHVAVSECRTDFTVIRTTDRAVMDAVSLVNLKAVPTIEADDVTVQVSDVANFNVLAGVDVIDACEDLVATPGGQVPATEGAHEITYTVVDGYGNEASATRTVTVVADAEPEPAPTVTVTETVTAEPTATPTVTETVTAEPTAPVETPGADLYETPGFHNVNGRRWMTVCEPYSSTTRCFTYIWATQVQISGGQFVETQGWAFNNLTYVAAPKSIWEGNPLAETGRWTDEAGRNWRTECNTEATGGNGCRTYVETSVIERTPSGYRQVTREVFNNMVRFS